MARRKQATERRNPPQDESGSADGGANDLTPEQEEALRRIHAGVLDEPIPERLLRLVRTLRQAGDSGDNNGFRDGS